MAWHTATVYRVIVDVTRYTGGGPETETIVLGPYATVGGARSARLAQQRRYEDDSRLAVELRGEEPWVVHAYVEWAEVEWTEDR